MATGGRSQSPSSDRGPALRVYQPGGDGVSGLGGWLRLHGGRSPALSADLEYVQANPGQPPTGQRLQERRVLGLETLHYLDSPRVGVLARVTVAR